MKTHVLRSPKLIYCLSNNNLRLGTTPIVEKGQTRTFTQFPDEKFLKKGLFHRNGKVVFLNGSHRQCIDTFMSHELHPTMALKPESKERASQ
jgi:hypothetical protein